MRCQELLFGASILGAAIALNMRPELTRCHASCGGGNQPAFAELAGQTRTSGLRRVMQWVISRRPLVREICIDRVSYKNASAKQTHD
jgi:hypothetical protein